MDETQLELLHQADAAIEHQKDRQAALVTRATALVGVAAVGAPVVARAGEGSNWLPAFLVVLAVSVTAGLSVIVGRDLVTSPNPRVLRRYAELPPDVAFVSMLEAKNMAFDANETRVRVVEIAWVLHVTGYALAAVAPLVSLRG